MFAGLLCFLANLWMTWRGAEAAERSSGRVAAATA
jgi:hypothetical protein